MTMQIHMTDIEAAINYWRQQKPSVGEEMRLCPEASALASYYAMMIVQHQQTIRFTQLNEQAQTAFQDWQRTQRTTPY